MSKTSISEFKVQFVEMPDNTRGRVAPITDGIVASACRKHPNQYAALPLAGRNATSLAGGITSAGSLAFSKGEFRATLRNGQVYVKFIG